MKSGRFRVQTRTVRCADNRYDTQRRSELSLHRTFHRMRGKLRRALHILRQRLGFSSELHQRLRSSAHRPATFDARTVKAPGHKID
jgi:hypothetical protein